MMFEGVTSGVALCSIVCDSAYNMYILTTNGYLTKWSRSGVNLMAPFRISDPYRSIHVINFLMDCYKATNTLYLSGENKTVVLSFDTNTFTTNIFAGITSTSTTSISVDNYNGKLYVGGVRFTLDTTPTLFFNSQLSNINTISFQLTDGSGYSFGSLIQIMNAVIYPCFLQGARILRLDPETDEEEYIAVEKLRRGDLIRTATCGYKTVAFIGRGTLRNPAGDPNRKNRLYKFQDKNKRHPPLFITGDHCLLYKEKDITPEKRREVREYMGDDYITEVYHRVPACLDEHATQYEGNGPVTIWHFALEHNNLYNNYAVYANGILVETCSIDFLIKRSSMELIC